MIVKVLIATATGQHRCAGKAQANADLASLSRADGPKEIRHARAE
jgi:hypothetical protein